MARPIRKTLRFSVGEWSEISQKLEEHQIDFSTFARASILKKKIKLPIEKSLLTELSRIGNNLNQIARAVNKKESIKVLISLNEIEQQIKKLITLNEIKQRLR